MRATFVYGPRPNVPEYIVQGGGTATGAAAERIDWDEFGNLL
jgi:hypothetical protein